MKNFIRAFVCLCIFAFSACEDPYKNTTYQIYDIQPASTYLNSRSDEFSGWIEVLKYADMFNAINQSTELFTVFVPTNPSVEEFYKKRNVSSIEELGYEYARSLVQYHVINDTITLDDFIAGGTLQTKTLSGNYLSVSFDETNSEGGFNAVYINKEARIKEFANAVTNGYVYVLESVLSPMVESVYERLSGMETNKIFVEALKLTSWGDTLNTISTTIETSNGSFEHRQYFTLLSVSAKVFAKQGVESINDLIQKLGAGSDYTDKDNELYRYVAYHILKGSYNTVRFGVFDIEETSKFWQPMLDNSLLRVFLEDDFLYFNYANGEGKTQFVSEESDVEVRNGFIHQLDNYMPIMDNPQPANLYFDFCDFPDIASYINSYGVDGQIYQEPTTTGEEGITRIENLPCFNWQVGPTGAANYSYGFLNYHTVLDTYTYGWTKALKSDQLIVNIGYMGTLEMKTPTIPAGKYKVTLCFGYATAMDFMRTMTGGSNGALTLFTLNDENPKAISFYSSVTVNMLNMYESVIYDEIEFSDTKSYTLKLQISDPAASTNNRFRIQLDYLLFEPI